MGQVIPGTQVTLANDRGAIAKQGGSSSPQSGANINIDGNIISGGSISAETGIATNSGDITNYFGNIEASNGYVRSVSGYLSGQQFKLGTLVVFERGSTFPTSGLADGQRYYHTTYRSWFTYNSTDSKWRQEGPGVFNGSFPTVSDNTVAPKIQVQRIDRDNTVYFWNGSDWLGPQINLTIPLFPGLAGNSIIANTNNVWFDVHPDNSSDIYVESLFTDVLVNSNNSGNNSTSYWSYTYRFRNSSATTAVTGSANTSTFSVLALTPLVLLSNTKVTRANFYDLLIDVAKAGSTATPGTLFIDPMKMRLRLVG